MDTHQTDTPDPAETPPSDAGRGALLYLVRLGLRLRLINLLAVCCLFVGALCMCVVGVIKTFKAVTVFFSVDSLRGGSAVNAVPPYIAEAMDAFLVATVLVVFSTGIFHLFIMELSDKDFRGLRGFERVSSIRGLKKILGELIVIVLFVHFFRLAIEGDSFEWTVLVIPIGALLMAGALRLLRLDSSEK